MHCNLKALYKNLQLFSLLLLLLLIPHKFNLGRSCYAYYILIKLISFVSKRQHTLLYRTCKFIFVSHVHLYDTNVFNVLLIFYFKIYFYYDKNEYKMILHDIYPCLWVI